MYRELFDELLEGAEDDSMSAEPKLFILPEWAFDVLNEFVYQFQGFCQFRSTLFAAASKHKLFETSQSTDGEGDAPAANSGNNTRGPPHHVVESLELMREDAALDVWSVDTVIFYLNRFVEIGTNPKCNAPVYQYFGIFASVALSRLECLLSDYPSSLSALAPILENSAVEVVKHDQETKSFTMVVQSVFQARLSLTYHAGISFLMLRRYKDAATTVGDLCAYMNRGFKTGQLRNLPYTDQLFKNYDRMIALLAICTSICSQPGLVDESISKAIREKHGSHISKDAYTELFVICAPKFVSPSIPGFIQVGSIDNAYKRQIFMLEQELKEQTSFKSLRSYLKLYTSIPVSKLLKFGNRLSTLPNLKLKMRQLESADPDIPSLNDVVTKSALDIHYYAGVGGDNEIVHVDEAEKKRRFENYFFGQINQSCNINMTIDGIKTTI